MIISSIDSQSLKLVEWIKVANSFPPIVVESQGDQDLECGWECGGWSRHLPHSVSNILPYRGCANVFVYSLDASTESLDSNTNYTMQPSICCPQDTNPEDIDWENITSLTVTSIRPPTLDAAEILAIEIENLDKVSKPSGMPFSSTEARSQLSKGVTSQIRTVGQFLVEFANQIENRIEQVEIARRDNIQR